MSFLKKIRSSSGVLGSSVWSWAFYDWANSAFATTVMAGFFPIFFKQYWSAGVVVQESSFRLGAANSLAALMVVLGAPILGTLADRGGYKKIFLFLFMLLGAVSTLGFIFVGQGAWVMALGLYVLGLLGFSMGNIFYDAMLVDVAKKNLDYVSAFGFSLGYLGGGVLFVINVLMYLKYEWFGFVSAASAIKWSFFSVGLWWFVFSLPLLLGVREARAPSSGGASFLTSVGQTLRGLHHTFKDILNMKALCVFLAAYFFYIDGVNTLIKMAVDYGMSLGFEPSHFITALIIVQVVAFPAALAFGLIGKRWGARAGIFVGLAAYLGICVWASVLRDVQDFYAMAVLVGLVQGGVQALSRSYFASLVPRGREGEFFGFFNMFGKFSALLGPITMGWVGVATGSTRLSVLVLIVFFVLGGALLVWHQKLVKKEEALAF